MKVPLWPSVTIWSLGWVRICGAVCCCGPTFMSVPSNGCVSASGTGCTTNEAFALARPGDETVTLTVPGWNCVRTAIFAMPPSASRFGSPGACQPCGCEWST
ncbi:Uncharacterised protein [Burkholderia gladioli]|nr:Uncharacterised protein [Burkholderia gladioli]